jgi:hypothetical protein
MALNAKKMNALYLELIPIQAYNSKICIKFDWLAT